MAETPEPPSEEPDPAYDKLNRDLAALEAEFRKAKADGRIPEDETELKALILENAFGKFVPFGNLAEPPTKEEAEAFKQSGTEGWIKWSHWQTVVSWALGIAVGVVFCALAILAPFQFFLWKLVLLVGLAFITIALPCFTWFLFRPDHRAASLARNIITLAMALLAIAGDFWCWTTVIPAMPGKVIATQPQAAKASPTPFPVSIYGYKIEPDPNGPTNIPPDAVNLHVHPMFWCALGVVEARKALLV